MSALVCFAAGCSADPTSPDGNGGSTAQGGKSSGGTSSAAGGTTSGNGGTTTSSSGGTSSANGGSSNGGATSGGSSNGGSSNGGSSNGGSSAGGSSNGGSSNGGSSNGGSSAGGSSNGGSSNGGSSNGGSSAGGSSNGGTTSGGVTNGGSSSGGASRGGATSGGAASGGAASGGAASGGAGTGGTTSTGNEFWISPTGNDSNAGTKASPLFSLCDDDLKKGACYKICPVGGTCLSGGATIWVMDGTYKYAAVTQKIGSTKLGTASGTYKVWAEAGAKPVFDFTGQAVADTSRGLQIQGDYWHVRGITVTKAGDTGIFVMGNNNTIERCIAHHNQDAGFVIGVNSSRSGSGVNNTILNCDSYQNYDSATNGENADGFGMKENTGAGNVFRGCRAWDNGDDGWDLYGWTSPVTIEGSWAMKQTSTIYGSASDGNGFKLGHSSSGTSASHKLTNCFAVGNGTHGSSGKGFTKNSNSSAMTCSGCGSWSNKAADDVPFSISRTSGPTADQMIAATRDANGNLPSIDSL
ncbi:MAG: right-handed parallel beta-helix repeat-containing protein [Polyangiaceae bacterium]